MQLREIMTAGVVTAGEGDEVRAVARLMRDRGVGSVVICDPQGGPSAMITDRDIAVRIAASDEDTAAPVGGHASRP
ncbi:MAG: CBS domain-containing protein, partial [Solirubrobacterales bacterium]